MGFDMNPADEDPHSDCRREIQQLSGQLTAHANQLIEVQRTLKTVIREVEVLAYNFAENAGGRLGPQCVPPSPPAYVRNETTIHVAQQLTKLMAALRPNPCAKSLGFAEACDRVCRDLPEDWQLSIELEKDAGSVQLTNPMGDIEDFPTNNERLEYTLGDALNHAIEQDPKYTRGPNPGQINPPNSDQE